jgi:hypothetical protein
MHRLKEKVYRPLSSLRRGAFRINRRMPFAHGGRGSFVYAELRR